MLYEIDNNYGKESENGNILTKLDYYDPFDFYKS